MKRALALAILIPALAACGVETATTAATVAEMKRREVEAAKKNLEQAKQKIEAVNLQVQQSAERNDPDKKE
jgi:beta-lactam-binding protein with PASTA domain